MSQKFSLDLKGIAQANLRVDLRKLAESQKVQKTLADSGYIKKGFELVTPFERVRSTTVDNLNRSVEDPTILG